MKQFKSVLAASALLVSAFGGSSLQAAIAGTFAAIGGFSGPEVLAINGATGATIDTQDLAGLADVDRAAWSSDGSFLLTGGVGDTGGDEVHVFAFDGTTLTEKTGAAVDVSSTVREVSWRADDAYFATIDLLDRLRTYSFDPAANAGTGESTFIDSESPPGIFILRSVDWHPDQSFIAVAGTDISSPFTQIMIYAVDAGGMIGTQDEAVDVSATVESVRWSPDGNHLVAGGSPTGGANLRLYSWDGSTTLTLEDSEDAGGAVLEVAWSPDGSHVAIGNSLGEVRVYSFDSGLETLTLEDTETFSDNIVNSVGWYPDGENILAGGNVDGAPDTGRYASFAYATGTESFTGTNWTVDQTPGVKSVDVRPAQAGKGGCDCEIDDCLVTSFRGNFAVDPCRKLLANFIDPVRLNGTTGKFEQDDDTESITCFSGNVGVGECRTLLTNRICPVVDIEISDKCTVCDAGDRGCEENAAGCLELCGDQVIIAGKLLVNDFGPFDEGCLTKDGIRGEPMPMRFASNVLIDGELTANGVSLSGLYDLVAQLQREIDQLKKK